MYILSISMCLQNLMNFHHCLFKILRKTKTSRMDGHTGWQDGWMDGRKSENSIPPINIVCGGYNKMAVHPAKTQISLGIPQSLVSIFADHMKKAWVLSYPLSTQRKLWVFAGRTPILLVLSCRGPFGVNHSCFTSLKHFLCTMNVRRRIWKWNFSFKGGQHQIDFTVYEQRFTSSSSIVLLKGKCCNYFERLLLIHLLNVSHTTEVLLVTESQLVHRTNTNAA